MQAVNVVPAGALKCYRFQVSDTGTVLALPAKACTIAIFNDDATSALYIDPHGSIPTAPDPVDTTIRVTDKILPAAESPWVIDFATDKIGLLAATGATITVRVDAYFQLLPR